MTRHDDDFLYALRENPTPKFGADLHAQLKQKDTQAEHQASWHKARSRSYRLTLAAAAVTTLVLLGLMLGYYRPPQSATLQQPTPPNLNEAQPITMANLDQIERLDRYGPGAVNDIALSSDGQLLAVATTRGARLHDATTLERIETPLAGADVNTGAVFFRDDSTQLAVVQRDTVTLWDIGTGSVVAELPTADHSDVQVIGWADDRLATTGCTEPRDSNSPFCGGYVARLWDVPSGEVRNTIDYISQTQQAHTTADLDRLLIPTFAPEDIAPNAVVRGYTLRLFDFETGAEILAQDIGGTPPTMDLSADGNRLAFIDGSILEVHNVDVLADNPRADPLPPIFTPTRGASRIHLSANGQQVTLITPSSIDVYDTNTGDEIVGTGEAVRIRASQIAARYIEPEAVRIVTAGGDGERITVWQATTGQQRTVEQVSTLDAYATFQGELHASPGGDRLVSGSRYNPAQVRLWDVNETLTLDQTVTRDGELLLVIPGPLLDAKRLLYNGRSSDGFGGMVGLYDLEADTHIALAGGSDNQSTVFAVGDMPVFASRTPNGFDLLHMPLDGEPRMISLAGDPDMNYTEGPAVMLSPAGRFIAGNVCEQRPDTRFANPQNACNVSRLYLWDAQTGVLIRRLEGMMRPFVYGMAFSPDGDTFAAAGCVMVPGDYCDDDRVRVWDLRELDTTTDPLPPLFEITGFEWGPRELAFHPTEPGLLLANGFDGLRAYALDIEAANITAMEQIIPTDTAGFAFSPSGRLLYVGGPGYVDVWGVPGER